MAKRSDSHMEAQQERIIRAAIACIAEKGLDGTSIADIRRKAGLSTGALYVHFRNKGDIIDATLRFASFRDGTAPDSWVETLELLTSPDGQLGFDLTTVVRTRLHLHAECALPGPLHDAYRPVLTGVLDLMSRRLEAFAARGEIRLRMGPMQTAVAVVGLIDGMQMVALETDRPLQDLRGDLLAGIACLVEVLG